MGIFLLSVTDVDRLDLDPVAATSPQAYQGYVARLDTSFVRIVQHIASDCDAHAGGDAWSHRTDPPHYSGGCPDRVSAVLSTKW